MARKPGRQRQERDNASTSDISPERFEQLQRTVERMDAIVGDCQKDLAVQFRRLADLQAQVDRWAATQRKDR